MLLAGGIKRAPAPIWRCARSLQSPPSRSAVARGAHFWRFAIDRRQCGYRAQMRIEGNLSDLLHTIGIPDKRRLWVVVAGNEQIVALLAFQGK